MLESISIKSYAKLNLYLEITGKDSRNYHYLKTVMQSISLHDDLKFIVSDGEGINILCDKSEIPTDSSNLVWKAIEAFYDYTGLEKKSIDVMIKKKIPMMAGLAGGSSNAAAALHAMNRLYDNPLSVEQLCEIGGKIGSDIPFCVMGGTVLCEGFGEKLTPLNSIVPCSFIVVKPEEGISTPQAYMDFDSAEVTERPDFSLLKNGLENNNIFDICSGLYNDLDITCKVSSVSKIKNSLNQLGALNSMMTGSGSAVYGVFEDEESADKAADFLSNKYPLMGVYTPVNSGTEIIEQ